jgi:hypothetical protein
MMFLFLFYTICTYQFLGAISAFKKAPLPNKWLPPKHNISFRCALNVMISTCCDFNWITVINLSCFSGGTGGQSGGESQTGKTWEQGWNNNCRLWFNVMPYCAVWLMHLLWTKQLCPEVTFSKEWLLSSLPHSITCRYDTVQHKAMSIWKGNTYFIKFIARQNKYSLQQWQKPSVWADSHKPGSHCSTC